MPKKCPPGVFCIENVTLFFVVIIVMMVSGFLYLNMKVSHQKHHGKHKQSHQKPRNEQTSSQKWFGLFPKPSFSFSNIASDVFLNPYTAPLRNDNYLPTTGDPRGVPINISTRAVDTAYRQVGILTRVSGKETILPLMGRPLYVSRDKWQFYTISDKNNAIKLPISHKGKSCTNEYGCDNLYNGDTVFVEGYNDAFKVTAYDNAVMKYIPFI
jgi:hypothetical protein